MVKRLITLISGVLGAALSAPPLLEAVGVVASAYWAGSTWGAPGVAAVVAVASFLRAADIEERVEASDA
jgi:hypothetical protein